MNDDGWSKLKILFGAGMLLWGVGVSPVEAQVPEEMRSERVLRDSAQLPQRERPPRLDRQFRRALTAWRTGSSLFEAKARLDRVLQEMPGDVEARKLRADVLLRMGRPEEALRDARRAVALRPRDGEAHLLHAEAARESSHLDQARDALDQAAEYLPQESALHTRLSWNAMLLDRPAQAEAFGRVALALDSTSAAAYRQLARVFIMRDRPDEAASVLMRGLQEEVVQPRSIREDELLRQLTDHPLLESVLHP